MSYASVPPRFRRILLAMRKSPQGVDMNVVVSTLLPIIELNIQSIFITGVGQLNSLLTVSR